MTPAVVLNNTWTLAEFAKEARRAAGLRPRDVRPVRVVPGTAAPTVVGHHGHHETPGGAFVRYPGACRKAFGRPVYVHSTREVVVGAQWRPTAGGGK